MACTFVTFRARSAIREVGKAMGLPAHMIDQAAKALETYRSGSLVGDLKVEDIASGLGGSRIWQQIFDLCDQIEDCPRHLGIHNGGMIITGAPLSQRLPTEPALMAGRVVVQWDKDALETPG